MPHILSPVGNDNSGLQESWKVTSGVTSLGREGALEAEGRLFSAFFFVWGGMGWRAAAPHLDWCRIFDINPPTTLVAFVRFLLVLVDCCSIF